MKKIIHNLLLKFGFTVLRIKKDKILDNQRKRFQPYDCMFLSHKLYVHDYASFELGKNELFSAKPYNFEALNDAPYVIDCGANLGMSVIFFKTLYPNAKVLAFEADPYIFSFLEKNIVSFNFSDVIAVKAAVWDKAKEVLPFYTEGGAGGRLEKETKNVSFVNVETIRLKDYLNEKVDFLKIDIEGAEFKVIKDCEDVLKNVDKLFIEYHSFPMETQNLQEILKIVQKAGFKYHIKEAFTSAEPFKEIKLNVGMDLQLNIFCYREESVKFLN